MCMYGDALFFTQTSGSMASLSHYTRKSHPGHKLTCSCSCFTAFLALGRFNGFLCLPESITRPDLFLTPHIAILLYCSHTLLFPPVRQVILNLSIPRIPHNVWAQVFSPRVLNLFGDPTASTSNLEQSTEKHAGPWVGRCPTFLGHSLQTSPLKSSGSGRGVVK